MKYISRLFHPLAFCFYPFLAAWEFNYFEVWPWEFTSAIWCVIVFAALLLALLYFALRSIDAACVLLSITVVAGLAYGPLANWWASDSRNPGSALIELNFTLTEMLPLALWVLIYFIIFWRLRFLKERTKSAHVFLNIFAAILIVFSLLSISKQKIREVRAKRFSGPFEQVKCEAKQDFPDIYYIILDGFGRQDILKDIYSFDNSEFISFLKSSNFYIADKSTSNYHRTFFSLSSSLNSSLLEAAMLERMKDQSSMQAGLDSLIHNNTARKFFEKIGYQSVAFENGDRTTEVIESNQYVRSPGMNRIISTGISYFQLPWLRELISMRLHKQHRVHIRSQFESAMELGQQSKSKFVYLHILAPHPPFVFEEDGSPYYSNRVFTFGDGGDYGGADDYLVRYKAQAIYISELAIKLIKKLLSLPRKPIIIVQGDHGPGSRFDLNSLEKTDLHERFSILNAYFFPSGDYSSLYPSISPVNTFRAVVNQLQCTKMTYEKDLSFFSSSSAPLDFINISAKAS